MKEKVRCINLDWLEVHCEDIGLKASPEYFQRYYQVKVRAYGTPLYKEMFTLEDDGIPFIEIRRLPYSLKKNGGIFEENSVHVRLCNRACYIDNPIALMIDFCTAHKLRILNITRIDICLDSNEFEGEIIDPQQLIREYMAQKISKVNTTKVSAHGADKWLKLEFNSIRWGSDKSNVLTRLYNKTLEMKQTKTKQYIKSAWLASGLDVDRDVYRVEFALKSFNSWVSNEGVFLPNDLAEYDSREKILEKFYNLARRFLRFKRVVYKKDGKPQRKDRCPDVVIFIDNLKEVYRPLQIPVNKDITRTERILINYLQGMAAETESEEARKAIHRTIGEIASAKMTKELFGREEAVRQVMRIVKEEEEAEIRQMQHYEYPLELYEEEAERQRELEEQEEQTEKF